MKQNFRVAVLMATHNGGEYLIQQINSIHSQIRVSCTIFYSDDKSVDNTREILREYNCVNLNTDNLSFGTAAANFIYLITTFHKFADFDYVMLSDQDDVWLPNKAINAITEMHDQDSEVYFGSFYIWNPDDIRYFNIEKKYTKYLHVFGNLSPGFTHSFKNETFGKIQTLVKREYKHLTHLRWHDWLLFFIVKENNIKFVVSNSAHTLYRQHETNDTGLASNVAGIKMRIKFLFSASMQKQLEILKLFARQTNTKKFLTSATRMQLFDRCLLLWNILSFRANFIPRIALTLWIIVNFK